MTPFYRSTFLTETTTTSYQRSTFSKGNLDEIDNIYTYAFIYYNLSAVPKGGGGLGSFPCMPTSSLPAFIVLTVTPRHIALTYALPLTRIVTR